MPAPLVPYSVLPHPPAASVTSDCCPPHPPAVCVSGPSIHEIVHKMRDDQNTGATFSGANPPGLTINSGEIFEVTTLDASGGHITRNGEPQIGAEATPGRVHRSGGPASVIGPEDEQDIGTGSRAGYQVPGVTSGNPICDPVFVNGAEPGDTLQVRKMPLCVPFS